MTEAQLFVPGEFPFTRAWYASRAHAPHLEQEAHVHRLFKAAEYAERAVISYGLRALVDLGCGDGGLLSLLSLAPTMTDVDMWGYDLMPANVSAAVGRDVDVRLGDFVAEQIDWGELAICTEVLEHLEDPHGFLSRLREHGVLAVVASSPVNESAADHDPVHAWAWDEDGYRDLLLQARFTPVDSCVVDDTFQVWLAVHL